MSAVDLAWSVATGAIGGVVGGLIAVFVCEAELRRRGKRWWLTDPPEHDRSSDLL